MKGSSILARILGLALLSLAWPSAAAVTPTRAELSTPALIERAVARGELDRRTADRYLVGALRGDSIPERFESSAPYDGTPVLLELHERGEELHPPPSVHDYCDISTSPLPHAYQSTNFSIEYNQSAIGGGLTIDDYALALETAWSKEVDQFGWARPPVYGPDPAPGNKYPVRIDSIGPAMFGLVSNFGKHAGRVGDNPATAWNEGDADASCMVLNSNYDPFPGAPLVALQATVAHEFNHSIQFGWGVLDSGPFMPDPIFYEGGATWMEDEVFDEANDSYNYLWPVFEDDMGEYRGAPPRSPYDYWITWRGITERYGTGVAGGGEDVMQRLWETISRHEATGLEALDRAFQPEGTSLASAYHAYAIAAKFTKPCGGGYAAPYCLEEGPAYVAARGPTGAHGSLGGIGSRFGGSIPDNYSLNWILLPTGGPRFQVVLRNTSQGGRFRASLACDTGSRIRVDPFDRVAGPGETTFARSFDPAGCLSAVVVVTNVAQTSPNPGSSTSRSYEVSLTGLAAPSRTKVRVRVSGSVAVVAGRVRPPHRGEKIGLTLFRKAAGGWRRSGSKDVALKRGKRFRATVRLPAAARCRIEAVFRGDADHLPSRARRAFPC